MASFPTSIKTFATLVDLVDSVLASHPNQRGDEITAIETFIMDGAAGETLVGAGAGTIPVWTAGGTAIEGLVLSRNSGTSISVGTGVCFAENGDKINVTSTLTASSLSLSTSTFYHVYVYLSAGVPAVEVVTTAPVAWKGTAYSKTGDTSRRYVGSILSDGSSNVRNFMHDPAANIIYYLNNNISATPYRVLSNGTATSATSVSFTGIVPETVVAAFAAVANTDTVDYANVGIATLTTSAFDFTLSAGVRVYRAIPLVSQTSYYIYGASPSSGLYIDVSAYSFKR